MRLTRIAVFAFLSGLSATSHAQTYTPKGPIEQKYMADGSWAVTYTPTSVACDREGNLCDIWYPTNLGANGFRHPVVVWGNGTTWNPLNYAYWLRHLATWGFIVVGSRDTETKTGETMIDAANYIITQGNTVGSIFYGKVDGAKVGAAGHSQGGCTSTLLFAKSTPPFSVYYAPHPGPAFFSAPLCGLHLPKDVKTTKNKGAILFMAGAQDGDGGIGTRDSFYNPIPATATKGFGSLAQANHNDILGQPGCGQLNDCVTGVYGYLGYPTAWFMWKLQGASDGPAAFSSTSGEFMLQTPDWIMNYTNVP